MDPAVLKIVFPLWVKSFALSLVIEVPIFVLVARFRASVGRALPIWRLMLAATCGTCCTHPLLWFAWPLVVSDYTTYIVSGELIVAVVESLVFFTIARPIGLGRAVAASFIGNGISYSGGVLLSILVGVSN